MRDEELVPIALLSCLLGSVWPSLTLMAAATKFSRLLPAVVMLRAGWQVPETCVLLEVVKSTTHQGQYLRHIYLIFNKSIRKVQLL